ncbi:MAG: MFS transporter [Eubacteriales bacterium]|nr:MFS transporter [Eubacteriales bacterium]
MRDKSYARLAFLYGVYFLALGASSFTAVFLSGKGMDNAQIGLLMSLPPIISLVVQPLWGLAGDRARYKRSVLVLSYAGTGLVCFLFEFVSGFWALLIVMCLYNCFSQACSPIMQTICMEYTANRKGGFGPIRMGGSITYQIMVLALGFILSGTMPQLFRIMGVIYIFCSAYSLLAPPIEGHQHNRKKMVSPFLLFKDKRIVLLLAMCFCGKCASMFYVSFFNKYTQELFQSNSLMSVLSFVSLVMEIPFLFFSHFFMRKIKITYWVMLGFAINAVRFIGISLTSSIPLMILLQLPAVSVMACFEFYPALYMNAIAPRELLGSVQSLNTVVTFGLTQLLGSLVGGIMADAIGLQASFGVFGLSLVVAMAAFYLPARKADMNWPEPDRA